MKKKSQSRSSNHRIEKMTPYMEKWLEEVEKDIKAGKNMSGPFYSVKELMKHLNKKSKKIMRG